MFWEFFPTFSLIWSVGSFFFRASICRPGCLFLSGDLATIAQVGCEGKRKGEIEVEGNVTADVGIRNE